MKEVDYSNEGVRGDDGINVGLGRDRGTKDRPWDDGNKNMCMYLTNQICKIDQ